jgi:hypothetical protein
VIRTVTSRVVKPMSSGSVIGVDCKYSTFGFNAKTATAAIAAGGELVIERTIEAIAPHAIANDTIEIATADAPVR